MYAADTWSTAMYGADTWSIAMYGADTWSTAMYGADTWSIAMYGADTWTLREVYQKYFERFDMWCWRMEKISGPIVSEMKR